MTKTASARSRRAAAFHVTLLVALAVGLTGCVAPAPPTRSHAAPSTAPPPASATPLINTSPAADRGPTTNAEGTAKSVSPGHFEYTVAAGDTPSGIASRFGVCLGDLFAANTGLQGGEADMQVGQTITVKRVPSDNDAPANCMVWPSS